MNMCFITPDDDIINLKYYNVEDYCKKICEDEKEEFLEFSKDYSYFNPYFDYVVFKKKYAVISPLLNNGFGLFPIDGALYLERINNFSYKELESKVKAQENKYNLSYMTNVSDVELGIKKTGRFPDDGLVDHNMVSMMSKSGTVGGSHSITANSVLNQLMIRSKKICSDYKTFLINKDDDKDLNAVNYIVSNLGFLRCTSPDEYPLAICNINVLSNTQNEFVEGLRKDGYLIHNVNEHISNSNKNYEKIIKKPEK